MERVKRRLFNLVAGMSLILAVAVGVLWVRSYWWYETIMRDKGSADFRAVHIHVVYPPIGLATHCLDATTFG